MPLLILGETGYTFSKVCIFNSRFIEAEGIKLPDQE